MRRFKFSAIGFNQTLRKLFSPERTCLYYWFTQTAYIYSTLIFDFNWNWNFLYISFAFKSLKPHNFYIFDIFAEKGSVCSFGLGFAWIQTHFCDFVWIFCIVGLEFFKLLLYLQVNFSETIMPVCLLEMNESFKVRWGCLIIRFTLTKRWCNNAFFLYF